MKKMLLIVLFIPFIVSALPPAYLTKQQQEEFKKNGFVVIKDFLTSEQCKELKQEAQNVVAEFDLQKHASVFSTTTKNNCSRDNYFFDSVDKVHCFLEDGVFQNSILTVEKSRAFNKIGHALHDKNQVFKRITFCPEIVQYAHDIGIINPIVMQSMFIFKSAKTGGEVLPHQDATFLYTEPISVCGFWIALDDATTKNACMWAIPGSHKGPLYQRYVADKKRELSFVGDVPKDAWNDSEFIPLNASKGTLIIFSGKLVHKSLPNNSDKDRNAYTFHVIGGDAEYAKENWLQRADAPKLVVH